VSDLVVSPAIVGLLRTLPPLRIEGVPVVWRKEDKEKWMKAFAAIIEMTYPDPDELERKP
jgi:hypothetical protein